MRRQSLDRRFEAAHLRYAMLEITSHYSEQLQMPEITILPDTQLTLQELTPKLHSTFQAQYSG